MHRPPLLFYFTELGAETGSEHSLLKINVGRSRLFSAKFPLDNNRVWA
jgi:hypothetical protein